MVVAFGAASPDGDKLLLGSVDARMAFGAIAKAPREDEAPHDSDATEQPERRAPVHKWRRPLGAGDQQHPDQRR